MSGHHDGDGASQECAAVMVCDGSLCGQRTDDRLDVLKPLIRLAPRSILMRTACPTGGTPCRASHPTVVLQRCDAGLQARGPARVVATDDLCELRRVVAHWLLSDESMAR